MTDSITFDDRFTGILEPDTLLPSQFFGALRRKAHLDGERRLMVAVLEDAVNCFQKQVRATDPKARQLFLDAEEWITSTDQSWFFSFVNVCETLDLDPDYVREGLLAWRDRQLRSGAVADEDAVSEHEEGSLRKASGA
jgi:hypothetical protein